MTSLFRKNTKFSQIFEKMTSLFRKNTKFSHLSEHDHFYFSTLLSIMATFKKHNKIRTIPSECRQFRCISAVFRELIAPPSGTSQLESLGRQQKFCLKLKMKFLKNFIFFKKFLMKFLNNLKKNFFFEIKNEIFETISKICENFVLFRKNDVIFSQLTNRAKLFFKI